MTDQDRKSRMEKAEGDRETAEANQRSGSGSEPKWQSDPRDQEPMVERRPYHNDPTRVEDERTSDASTIASGGVSGGRPQGGAAITPERARAERRAPESGDDVMPDDSSTLNTKI